MRELSSMVVVGVDPGLAATGYAVVRRIGRDVSCEDYGCVRTKPASDTGVRLRCIYDGLCATMDHWNPQVVVVEEAFMRDSVPKAAISIGQVIGVVLLAASQHECVVHSIAVRSIKQAVAGAGAADKSQIARALRHIFRLSEDVKPDHAADALGLAYVGALRYGK